MRERYHDKKYPVLFSMQMTEQQRKKLTTLAKKLGISAAEVVRRMIG